MNCDSLRGIHGYSIVLEITIAVSQRVLKILKSGSINRICDFRVIFDTVELVHFLFQLLDHQLAMLLELAYPGQKKLEGVGGVVSANAVLDGLVTLENAMLQSDRSTFLEALMSLNQTVLEFAHVEKRLQQHLLHLRVAGV